MGARHSAKQCPTLGPVICSELFLALLFSLRVPPSGLECLGQTSTSQVELRGGGGGTQQESGSAKASTKGQGPPQNDPDDEPRVRLSGSATAVVYLATGNALLALPSPSLLVDS